MAGPLLQDRGTWDGISGCCSLGFSTLQTQLDLRAQFTAGCLNPSKVCHQTGSHLNFLGSGNHSAQAGNTPPGWLIAASRSLQMERAGGGLIAAVRDGIASSLTFGPLPQGLYS